MLSEFEKKMLSLTGVNNDSKTKQLMNFMKTQHSRKVYISEDEYKNIGIGKWLNENNEPQRQYIDDRGLFEVRNGEDGHLYAMVLSYVDETSNKYLVFSHTGAITLFDPENDAFKSLEDLEAVDGENAMELEDVFKILDKQDILTPSNISDGTLNTIIGFDSQGNLKKAAPTGNVIDDEFNINSTNPVQNKVITNELSKKANVDGNYPTMTVGLADNLTPYSEDSGAEQDEPFILQGTGCGNGTEIVTTGDYALLKEKQGNTLKVLQLAKALETGNYGFASATGSLSGGVATFTASATNGRMYNSGSNRPNLLANHKYIGITYIKTTSATDKVAVAYDIGTTQTVFTRATTALQQLFICLAPSSNSTSTVIRVSDTRDSDWDAISVYGLYIFDITEWDTDIITDLTAHPENFFRYYQGSLAYNTGSLETSDGRYLVATGRNIWDEQWEVGGYDSSTGQTTIPSNKIRSKNTNPIKVQPNTTYYSLIGNYAGNYMGVYCYDSNGQFIRFTEPNATTHLFTTPVNCSFIRFDIYYMYGTTYNHDITITPYYTPEQGGEGYDQYYPYEEPFIVDTGNETLLSAGSVRDYKEPNGTIHRLVGTRAYQSGDENDSSLLTDGTTTYYPLATPTNEQGTPFSPNLKINDYGQMGWLNSSNNPVSIPQGNLIFYPVNYKGFVDDVYSRTSGDASKIALASELATSFETYLKGLSGYDATETQVLKNVEGTLTWVKEE